MIKFHFVITIVFLVSAFNVQEISGQAEEGIASYYHGRFHGRKTSSGILHDNNALVAAHRTYPFGTYLLVTNLNNSKQVVVCVTDRGPRKKSRIIDLSKEAARQLEFIKKGITRVRVEPVPRPFFYSNSLDFLLLWEKELKQVKPHALDSFWFDFKTQKK